MKKIKYRGEGPKKINYGGRVFGGGFCIVQCTKLGGRGSEK